MKISFADTEKERQQISTMNTKPSTSNVRNIPCYVFLKEH